MKIKYLTKANKYKNIKQDDSVNKKNKKFHKQSLKYVIILLCICAFIFCLYKLFIKKVPSIRSIPFVPSLSLKEKIYLINMKWKNSTK